MLTATEHLRKRQLRVDAFQWVTWLRAHERAEFDRVIRYGTPSDRLVELADSPIPIRDRETNTRRPVLFPWSLNTVKGQRKLYEIVPEVDRYARERTAIIPVLAWRTLGNIPPLTARRRTERSREIAALTAEAILHRSATEFAGTVRYSFETITVWIEKARGQRIYPNVVGDALRFWDDHGDSPFRVVEWGKQGGFGEPTTIAVNYAHALRSDPRSPYPRITIGTCTSGIDRSEQQQAHEWWLLNAHAMIAVHDYQDAQAVRTEHRRAEQAEARRAEHAEQQRRASASIAEAERTGRGLLGIPDDVDLLPFPTTVVVVEDDESLEVIRLDQPDSEERTDGQREYLALCP